MNELLIAQIAATTITSILVITIKQVAKEKEVNQKLESNEYSLILQKAIETCT